MIEIDKSTNIKEFPEWSEFPKDPQPENDYRNIYHDGFWTISGGYIFLHYKEGEIQYRELVLKRNTHWTWRYININKFDLSIDPLILIMEELL